MGTLSKVTSFIEFVIGDLPEKFTGLEINGVRHTGNETKDGAMEIEIDNEHPDFYSAYLRHVGGCSVWISNYTTHSEAVSHGHELVEAYKAHGWTFTDAILTA